MAKKYKLKLTSQYFIVLWSLAFIPILIAIYYPIKLINYPIKSEIRLPDEYRLLMELMQRVDKISHHKNEIELNIKGNPFVEPLPKTQNLSKDKLHRKEVVIKLSTIISHDQKICIINQKRYKEGDKIGQIKIEKIGDYYVDLRLPNKKKVRLEVGSTYILVY